jgi:hypothetical protein
MPAPRYVAGYTMLLLVSGVLLGIGTMTLFNLAGVYTEVGGTLRILAWLEAIQAAGCLLVAALRARGLAVAAPATAAISILLILWIPLGTAAFVWWLVRLRQEEADAS